MKYIVQLISNDQVLALFLSLTLGHLIGKIRIKSFSLGNSGGILFAGIIVSNFGGTLDHEIGVLFFGLFLYAIGYESSGNFFNSFSHKSFREVLIAFIMALSGFVSAVVCAKLFRMDLGMIAGISAGALTQSPILGSTVDSLEHVQNISMTTIQQYKASMSEGFAISYLFGVIGTTIFCTSFLEKIFNSKLDEAAIEYESSISKTITPSRKPDIPTDGKTTDFIFLGGGFVVAAIFSQLGFHLHGISIKLGVVSSIFAGLLVGWINNKKPQLAFVQPQIIEFLKDFGLSVFMATIGLSAGQQALHAFLKNGIEVVIASMVVSFTPLCIAYLIGRYICCYTNVTIFACALAGAHSMSAAFGVILQKSKSTIGVSAFTVSFVMANILLTMIGPFLVVTLL